MVMIAKKRFDMLTVSGISSNGKRDSKSKSTSCNDFSYNNYGTDRRKYVTLTLKNKNNNKTRYV